MYAHQSGFRRYHGTETALIRIIDQMLFDLDKNRVSGLVFIDHRKAFDMVDHEILMANLKAYGMSDGSVTWFQSYLCDRQQFVSIGGHDSTRVNVFHGVPQGSILGPLFFIIFINDLPLHIQSEDVELDLYADNTTLSYSTDIHTIDKVQDTLNCALRDVEDWANSNKLPLNKSKSKSLLITEKRLKKKISSEDQLSLITSNGELLEQVDSARRLGLGLVYTSNFICAEYNCLIEHIKYGKLN